MSGRIIVVASNPAPSISSLNPTSRQAGTGSFNLQVNGSNFVSNSVVRWNGSDRTTTFQNSGQVTASINAADILLSGTASITVFNPSPGGGTSGSLTFTMTPGQAVDVAPTLILTTIGEEFSGGLNDILASDDQRYQLLCDAQTLSGQAEIRTSVAPTVGTTPTIAFTCEAVVERPGLAQEIALYNALSQAYEVVDGRVATTSDSTVTISRTNGARFVDNGTHNMRAHVSWGQINDEDPAQDGWVQAVDFARWTVSP
jgi:hypothetical protein